MAGSPSIKTADTEPHSLQRRLKIAAICIVLVALVFIVFGQTIHFGFINFDDDQYVYENQNILKGPSLSGIGWAFTHVLNGHWHPLTAIVLMLQARFFGTWAGGYHIVNTSLHAACAVLLFLMLLEMTGALWRSAFVAALFAIHPLRAESVAWVSECKDVLSGVFFMLTLWAYARYARRPKSWGRYAMVLLWFALGLLSKPMLVTVPCLLLLLDYWPLGRLRHFSQFPRLLWEKIPLFVLSLLSSLATVFALRSGTNPIFSYPANIPIQYFTYLAKLIYPIHLAALNPIPKGGSPPGEVAGALALLALLTAGAWLLRRRQPFLLTGWLWYLGMLLPVSGIMETGGVAYADRYTYLPQIGLGIAGAWLAAQWAGQRRSRRAILGCAAAAILCALAFAAWRQTTYWHDSVTLWTRTLEYTRDNFLAHNGLASALVDEKKLDDATVQYREALQANPLNVKAYIGLGNILSAQGRADEAYVQFHDALQIDPNDPRTHYDLACVLFQQGFMESGIAECREALRLQPTYAEAHNNLANALVQVGRPDKPSTPIARPCGTIPHSSRSMTTWPMFSFSRGAPGKPSPNIARLCRAIPPMSMPRMVLHGSWPRRRTGIFAMARRP